MKIVLSNIKFLFLSGIVFYIMSCNQEEINIPTRCEELSVSYKNDLLPIIESKCSLASCHDIAFKWGDFDTYEDLKERADNGQLWLRISVTGSMPPAGNPKLTNEELELFKCWLNDGALNN